MDVVQLDDVCAIAGTTLEGINGNETVAARPVLDNDGLVPEAAQLVRQDA